MSEEKKIRSVKEEKPEEEELFTRKRFIPLHETSKLSEAEKYLECKLCGKKFQNLATHLRLFHEMTAEEYKEKFPDTRYFASDYLRILNSKGKYNLLKSRKRHIEQDEIDFIKDNHGKLTAEEMAVALDLNVSTIEMTIRKYIKRRLVGRQEWSEKDIEFLRENYYTMPTDEIAQALNRPREKVSDKAGKLRLMKKNRFPDAEFYSQGAPVDKCNRYRHWIEEEIEYLKNNYKTTPIKEMARYLGRGRGGVVRQLELLNLVKVPNWTEKDMTFLRENYKKYTNPQLGKFFGKTAGAIQRKLAKMGLRRS